MRNKTLFILSAVILCIGILLVVLFGGPKGPDYEIREETLQNNGNGNAITIQYPQLYSDNHDFSALNGQISGLLAQFLYDCYGSDITDLSLTLEYEIVRQDEKWLSVIWKGFGSVAGTAHPNDHLFSINLNVTKETRLRLTDMIRPEDGFLKILRERFVNQNERASTIFESYTDEELLEMIAKTDQGGLGGFSYLSGKSLVISLPVAHAAGDHAETEIPLVSLKDYMKVELG